MSTDGEIRCNGGVITIPAGTYGFRGDQPFSINVGADYSQDQLDQLKEFILTLRMEGATEQEISFKFFQWLIKNVP